MSTGDQGLGPLERRFFDSHDASVQALGAAGERVAGAADKVAGAASEVSTAAATVAESAVASKDEAVANERRDNRLTILEGQYKALDDRLKAREADSTISKWALVAIVVGATLLPMLGVLGTLLVQKLLDG